MTLQTTASDVVQSKASSKPSSMPSAKLVKAIHDEYRTALLNTKYYGCRLDQYQRRNKWMEIAIAIGATGSGIAGFAIWQQGPGVVIWFVISGISITLATIKPVINLPKEIERYSKLSAAYARICQTYRIIEQDFHATGFSEEHIIRFNQLREEVTQLVADDDGNPIATLVLKFEAEVKKEIPVSSLWMPPTG